jgi:plastocyanin
MSIFKASLLSTITHHVDIQGFAFVPARFTVYVGDTIEWTNKDLVPHSATADSKHWDTRMLVNGTSAHIVVTRIGTASFHCLFHPQMKGTVIVKSRTERKS